MKYIILFSIFIFSCNNDFQEKLPNDFEYIDEGGEVKFIMRSVTDRKELYMPCVIEKFTYNDSFILALQKYDTSCYKAYDGNQKLEIGNYYYWIMDIKNDSLYGPLNKVLFNEKAISLKVPEDLMIR